MPNIEDLAPFDPNTMEFPTWFSKFELFIRLAFSSCLWIVHAPLLGLHDKDTVKHAKKFQDLACKDALRTMMKKDGRGR